MAALLESNMAVIQQGSAVHVYRIPEWFGWQVAVGYSMP
jgi:hypothetical protein